MPLMQRNSKGVFVDISDVPVPKPQPSKVETFSQPLTEEGIEALVAETGVDDDEAKMIDCSTVPDGRYGRGKVEKWYADNGLPVNDELTKAELVADAKALCAEQEQS